MQAPVMFVNTGNGERQTGRQAQMSNITAAKTVADIIRSCLGPKAMLKMLLDPMGGIVLTNDGHAILREIEVAHPAAKSMIELARTQDEEVGDGTTTVIILAGEMLALSLPQLDRRIHPVVIIQAYKRALADALSVIEEVSIPVDVDNTEQMRQLIGSSLGTKFTARWSDLMCDLALKAVRTVSHNAGGGKQEVDIKRYARVEKVPGGEIEDSCVLDGVMLNKDITHPKMRRRIENPRIVLLDCTLEYKKGESQTNIEITKDPKACTILLRGPSKDILNEIDRNLADAMAVARNVIFHPYLSPGGGATEMAVSVRLAQKAKAVEGVAQWPYKAIAEAMEVIPRTLIQNSGSSPIRVLTQLRAKHAEDANKNGAQGGGSWGIDGDAGKIVDMKEFGVWEPQAVKLQSIKTAVESACLLLRVDDIVGAKAAKQAGMGTGGAGDED